ncbi:MAG TPA: alpha/beta fold hydrolase [Chroococcales cyanobacterium]
MSRASSLALTVSLLLLTAATVQPSLGADEAESAEQKRMHASVSVEVQHSDESNSGSKSTNAGLDASNSSAASNAASAATTSSTTNGATADSASPAGAEATGTDKKRKLTPAEKATAAAISATLITQPGIVREEESDIGKKLTLPVTSLKKADVPTRGIILAIHGATLYGDTYNSVAQHWASEGFPVYAMDMRGYGRWRFQNEKYHSDTGVHYTETREDIVKVLEALKQEYPDTPIFCVGESLGSNMAIWTAADRPDLLDGAILSSPCVKQAVHPRPRWIADFIHGLRRPYEAMSIKPYIDPYLSEDKRVTAAYLADPLINRYLSAADLIKSMRTNQWSIRDAHKIPANMPMLVVAGKKDKIYRADAIPEMVKNLGTHNVEVHVEPTKGHLLLETKYFDQATLDKIDSWLTANLATLAKLSKPEKISESNHAIVPIP